MSRSENSKKLDSIQAPAIAHLKTLGFRHRGRTLNRETESGIIQAVNFQLGAHGGTHAQFTINLGIFIPEVYEAAHTLPAGEFISEGSCEIRARIGHLMPEQRDYWWSLHASEPDPEISHLITVLRLPILERFTGSKRTRTELSNQILEYVTAYGLPFLERYATRERILQAWQNEDLSKWMYPRAPVSIAMIKAAQGDKAGAKTMLQQYYDCVDKAGHADFVLRVATKLDITLKARDKKHDEQP